MHKTFNISRFFLFWQVQSHTYFHLQSWRSERLNLMGLYCDEPEESISENTSLDCEILILLQLLNISYKHLAAMKTPMIVRTTNQRAKFKKVSWKSHNSSYDSLQLVWVIETKAKSYLWIDLKAIWKFQILSLNWPHLETCQGRMETKSRTCQMPVWSNMFVMMF